MRITYDTSEVEVRQTGYEVYDGPDLKPGTYNAEIIKANFRKTKAGATAMNFLLRVGHDANPKKDQFAGATVFHEVYPESPAELTQIRVAQILKAICGKQKAAVDGADIEQGGEITKVGGKAPVGTKLRVSVRMGSYNGEPRIETVDVFTWPKGEAWLEGSAASAPVEDDEPDEVDEEDPVVEDDEEGVEGDEEEVEEDDDEEEDDGEFEARKAELSVLDRTALKKVIADLRANEILPATFKVLKSHTDDQLREAILDAEFPVESGSNSDEEEDGETPF